MTNLYKGYRKITHSEIEQLYNTGRLPDLFLNQYVIDPDEKVLKTTLNDYGEMELQHLKYDDVGIHYKNTSQLMAFDLLSNENIKIKSLTGVAGGGKTFLAIKYGIHKLKKYEGNISRVMIIRQPEPVGKDIGFVKGEKETKLNVWFKPIVDNLEGGETEFTQRKANGQFEVDIPAHVQGRSIPNTFIIVDEAQLLTKEQVKMLGTRVGENSEIVFCGDYKQTLVNKYKGKNNGLIWMNEKLKGHRIFGSVQFDKSERSDTAELFASLEID